MLTRALSFADKLIVIKDNKILENNSPKEIYNRPKEKYIAALFDDVNEIIIDKKTVLLYPHQIKFVQKSELKATVLNSYFKGSYWLIEADFKGQKVFLNHSSQLKNSKEINISFTFQKK